MNNDGRWGAEWEPLERFAGDRHTLSFEWNVLVRRGSGRMQVFEL